MSTKWKPPRPSAYTPFLRRFTDERGRELADSRKLFKEVSAQFADSGWADKSAVRLLYADLIGQVKEHGGIPESLDEAFNKLHISLIADENVFFPIEEVDWASLSLDEQVELRELLRAQQYFLRHETACTELFAHKAAALTTGIAQDLMLTEDPNPLFQLPLYSLLRNTNETIEAIIGTLGDDDLAKHGLLFDVRRQLYLNLAHASGIVPDTEQKKPFLYPMKNNLAPREAVETYLRYTPSTTSS